MQHFVNLETFLWRALHFFEPQSADYTSELTRERMKQCEDHSWSKEARGRTKRAFFRVGWFTSLWIGGSKRSYPKGSKNNKKEIIQLGSKRPKKGIKIIF